MKPLCLIASLVCLFVSACSPSPTVLTVTPAPTITHTSAPEPAATVTPTPLAPPAPSPTRTAIPSPTTVPTSSLFLQSPQAFEAVATFQVGLGDLDGDRDLDAVFANMESYTQVWLNDGTGNFVDTRQRLTQQGHGVGIGDLDGDGDLDLFITCAGRDGSDKRSTVYLNDGAANFSAGQSLGDLKPSGNSIELIDIDGDGDLDACIQYYELPYKVYLNDGQGTFSQSEIEFPDSLELAWGDLDSDGDADVFAKELGKGYKTLLNDGAGHFKGRWQMPDNAVEYGYRSVTLGDLDGDGDLDAFVTNGSLELGYPTRVLLNDGSGQFSANGQALPAVTKAWVELGDLDKDEDLDAFLVILKRPSQVWINDGKGHFSDSGLRLGNDSGIRGSALGDLDNDGDLDAFASHFFGGSNTIWLNTTR